MLKAKPCPQCGQNVPAELPLVGWQYFCHNAGCVNPNAPRAEGCETKAAATRAWNRSVAGYIKNAK